MRALSLCKKTITLMQSFDFFSCCEIVNKIVTKTDILITNPMKILLISDTHLGAAKPINESQKLFFQCLIELISLERPTHIFHLGDLVNGCILKGEKILEEALRKFDKLNIPTYVIGGNHDRCYAECVRWKDTQNVHLVRNYALHLEIASKKNDSLPTHYYFVHDLGNNYRIRGVSFGVNFANWIKTSSDIIRPDDWMITGHIHTQFFDKKTKTSCIGQYSPEIHEFKYAVLTIGNKITYELKNQNH